MDKLSGNVEINENNENTNVQNNNPHTIRPLGTKFNKKFSILCDLFEKVSIAKTNLKIK